MWAKLAIYLLATYTKAMKPVPLKKLHPVYGITAMCAGVLLGVVVARFWFGGWLTSWLWYIVGAFLALILFKIGRWWCVALLCLVGVLIGYVRGAGEILAINPIVKYYDQNVEVAGLIAEDIGKTKSGDGSIRLGLESVQNEPVRGSLWVMVKAADAEKLRRSDRVKLSGKLQPGFGAFNGSMYRATLISAERENARDPFLNVRDWLSGGIYQQLPEKEAALGAGYILGQKQALPVDFDESLRIVGLTHVVVASGYNLTILVRLARRLFSRVSRYMAALAGGTMTLVFMFITGFSPSMVRAGMVAGLSLAAWYYGRKLHPVVLILLTAATSVLIQPSYAWGDVGWMLSFAAFTGVLLLAPALQAYFYGNKTPSVVRQILGETFSAQLFTLPIILMMFGTLSNVALVANLLVLPLVPLAMLLVFMTALASLWLPILAPIIAAPTSLLLQYMTSVVDSLAGLSWAAVEVKFDWQAVVLSYVLIGLVTVWLQKRSKLSYGDVNIVK